jgi:hypothetical protein
MPTPSALFKAQRYVYKSSPFNTEGIYFPIQQILKIKIDYFPTQHQLLNVCNGNVLRFL